MDLQYHQQRRLQVRLRDHRLSIRVCLQGSLLFPRPRREAPLYRHVWPLLLRPQHHRGRCALVHHDDQVRCRIRAAFQDQYKRCEVRISVYPSLVAGAVLECACLWGDDGVYAYQAALYAESYSGEFFEEKKRMGELSLICICSDQPS